jgi:hypothetical protein
VDAGRERLLDVWPEADGGDAVLGEHVRHGQNAGDAGAGRRGTGDAQHSAFCGKGDDRVDREFDQVGAAGIQPDLPTQLVSDGPDAGRGQRVGRVVDLVGVGCRGCGHGLVF